MAKTVEALGVVMTLGFSNLYFTVLEIKFFFQTLFFFYLPDKGENGVEKNRVEELKQTCYFEGGLHREKNRVFLGTLGTLFFSGSEKKQSYFGDSKTCDF